MPKVTVIIPSFNHEQYVAEAIQSVLNQTYQDFEIVITDDASVDRTVEIIREFQDPRIRLFCFEHNQGASIAANHCLEQANGEFIAMLSSDDVFLPEKLARQVSFLENNPKVGAVFSYAQIIDEHGKDFPDINHFYQTIFIQPNRTRFEWLNYFFTHGNCLCHPSALIRKQCYDEIGRYDERFAQLPDFDFWIRLCLKYELHILPEKLIQFRLRQNEANASGNRPDSRNRHELELSQILNHYLKSEVLENFSQIFSLDEQFFAFADSLLGAQKLATNQVKLSQETARLLVALVALQVARPPYQNFAINILYNLFSNQINHAQKLKEQFSVNCIDLIRLAGKYDVFNILNLEKLNSQLGKTQMQLQHSQSHLQEVQAALEYSQAKLHETRSALDYSQTYLQETQAALDYSQAQLQETRSALEYSQAHSQEIQAALEYSQARSQELQAALEYSQAQLQETRSALEYSQTRLEQTEAALQHSEACIVVMENTKFWQLRKKWLKLQQLMGFGRNS